MPGTAALSPSTPVVLGEFTGVLVCDGYVGYEHLQAVHAWCGAHLLRDLRSISDADPSGQLWATAMATTLLDANHATHQAREHGADHLDTATLKQIRNHYLGALARGDSDNRGEHTALAGKARTLINRFRRYENMILRFATDLSVPFTNNEAERCRLAFRSRPAVSFIKPLYENLNWTGLSGWLLLRVLASGMAWSSSR